ncbi:MAG: hypothetical protein N3E37_01990 [Candidatus Micrarchaeota archaeon]|nr:hypothetical protein [Candidatus Micrarchaeota archaeon]
MLFSGLKRLGELNIKIITTFLLILSLFVHNTYSKFTYITSISLNNSLGDYKLFEKAGPIYVDKKTQDLYIIDQGNRRFLIVSNNTVKKYLLGESSTYLLNPNGLHYSEGKFYIANGENLIEFDTETFSTKALRLLSNYENLVDVAVYKNNTYVLDRRHSRIIVNSKASGEFVNQFGGIGFFDGQMLNPSAIFIYEDMVYVADTGNKRIDIFSINGSFIKSFGRAEPGKLEMPVDLFVTNDYVFVADKNMQRVVVYNRTSTNVLDILYDYGDNVTEFFFPSYLHVDDTQKRLYVSDQGRNVVRVYSYEIEPEKPKALVEKGNKTIADIKLREANKSVEELLKLNDLAKYYGLNYVLSSKEFLDFSYRLYGILNYEDASANALQALMKAAEERAVITKKVQELQINKREELIKTYLALKTKISDSELFISTKPYLDCDEQLVTLINSNKLFEVKDKLNECESVLKKLDSDFKNEFDTKSNYLKNLSDNYKKRYQSLLTETQEYDIKVDLSLAFYLLNRFTEKVMSGKFMQAETYANTLKKEFDSIQSEIEKERKRRESIAEKIKIMNDQANELSKEFPEVYNNYAVEFTNLIISSQKTPEDSIKRAQELLLKINQEVKQKSEERQKFFVMLFLVIATIITIIIAFYFRKRQK